MRLKKVCPQCSAVVSVRYIAYWVKGLVPGFVIRDIGHDVIRGTQVDGWRKEERQCSSLLR